MARGIRPSRNEMQYLIDTDWVIDHLHRRQRTVRQLEELAPYGLAISIVSLAELYEGEISSTNPEREVRLLQEFLTGVAIIPLDDAICRIFARERSRLRASGTLIGDMDILIGSTALRHNLTLLTNNIRHFERLQGLRFISV
jgi:tRNA(fMet)-specific endonuclease VapC